MLNSILSNSTTAAVSTNEFLLCAAMSVLLGIGLAFMHTYRNAYSKNFLLTLTVLPFLIQVIIMLVNGNLGTGVAVMGAFSLVRFRSLPGNSREIVSVILAMGIGLATGMGYLGIAVWLLLITGVLSIVVVHLPIRDKTMAQKELKITIPENLDYYGIFDDLFELYTSRNELLQVKTVNMGSLYELHYHVDLKDGQKEKAFLDEIRCRNGNLNVSCGRIPSREGGL